MQRPTPAIQLLIALTTLFAFIACTAFAISTDPATESPPQPAPFIHETTDQYTIHTIEGFTVLVSQAATDHPDTTPPALALLRRQLKQTLAQTPEPTHSTLQQTKIWIEHNNPQFPGACYHPSADWLADNGYNTDKATGIEISNTINFVNWINTGQPSMVLHELAHAYQHATLDYNNPLVTKPYKKAKASGTYDMVDHISGTPKIHYAMNNEMEYFAELTEAYFGFNDFYPFARDQLKAHDPDGYAMIQQAWGLRDQEN